MTESTTPVPERRIDRFRPKLLIIGLAVLLAVIWVGAYTHHKNENKAAIEAAAFRAQGLASFFAHDVSRTLHYANDYAKAIRRIYINGGSLSEVRDYVKDIPPNLNILSHVTIMNSNGIPILITDGRKERKPKKIKHARDRNYFKFQKTNHHDTPFISQALKGR
ncbi:MAG: hypothetical protein ACKVHL_03155, partial [Rhodospirillales bacterium]